MSTCFNDMIMFRREKDHKYIETGTNLFVEL